VEEAMSIVLIADDFPPQVGGIQTYSCELARALVELGEEVAVCTGREAGSQEVDERLPYPVIRVPTKGSYPMAAMNLSDAQQQAAEMLQTPLRCVVATKWSPEGPAAILAHGALRCPMVLLGYGGEFSAPGGLVKRLVQRVVLRRMDLCLAISDYTAGLFRRAGLPEQRVGTIYGGVWPEQFAATDDEKAAVREELGAGDAPLIATVARLIERKGHRTVLEALPAVLERVPEAKYAIVGDGPMRRELEALAEELGVRERVIFAGQMPGERLGALYGAAQVCVMPSHAVRGKLPEGFGLVFLEAAAAGTPSIGSRFGGIPDAIEDGETGLLVEPQSPEELAAAITRLLTDHALRERMGEAARRRVEAQFTWRRVAERFLEHLRRLDGAGA